MANRAVVKFERRPQRLRGHWVSDLTATVRTRRGAAPKLTRRRIRKEIRVLQDLAESSQFRKLAVHGMRRLYEWRASWCVTPSKGRGQLAKRRSFEEWFDRRVDACNYVYVFWAKRRCRYVGRTENGRHRPRAHFEKHWMRGVTRIDIYVCHGRRNVPSLKCLETHPIQAGSLQDQAVFTAVAIEVPVLCTSEENPR